MQARSHRGAGTLACAWRSGAEGLHHQLLAVADVVENLPAEDEEAAVDPDVRLADRADRLHVPAAVTDTGWKVREGRTLRNAPWPAARRRSPSVGEVEVGHVVGVVGQEDLVAVEVVLDGLEPRADVGRRARVRRR